MLKRTFVLYIVLAVSALAAQNPINAFANVTAISGTTITVSNVNETFHSFEDGEDVIIMQMQDDVIGTNTTNASTFGDLGSIQSAGLFEIARILSHTESSSLPVTIVLTTALSNSYNINGNSSVQLITFRSLGSNFTSTANIGTVAWNGTVGGVTAMSITNVFTLNHNISANGAGFRGGVKNTPNGYSSCDNTTYATALATRYAGKGEGIYKNSNTAFVAGRGKILNGGGGGNDVNSGGGGGGNFTAGGGGGSGWVSAGTGCSPIVGGLGGISLVGNINGSQLYMGGGGGGGHENDGNGTVGGVGGGIILIRSGTLVTTSCAGIGITALGNAAVNAGNDGAGGGGAGGSILFSVNSFNIAGACTLTISASGGNGGNSNAGSGGAHGGGGGGGQGALIFSSNPPSSNATITSTSGTGGVSCGGCSSTLNGSIGTGTPNTGVVSNAPTILPIELLSFTGFVNNRHEVELKWSTGIEINGKRFVVEKMTSETRVVKIGEVPTTGNYSTYRFVDAHPESGSNYYRLQQEDLDGKISLKPWIVIELKSKDPADLLIYPNPAGAGASVFVECVGSASGAITLEIQNTVGGIRRIKESSLQNCLAEFDLLDLPSGLYIIKANVGTKTFYKKLLIVK